MATSYCGADCGNCGFGKQGGCKGCLASGGCPFGTPCFIAQYIKVGGKAQFDAFTKQLIRELNALHLPGMPEITELFPLNGAYVNLEYPLKNGNTVKFLDDRGVYLGCQVESTFNDGTVRRCFGIVADPEILLISEYGPNGADPEIVLYKKR